MDSHFEAALSLLVFSATIILTLVGLKALMYALSVIAFMSTVDVIITAKETREEMERLERQLKALKRSKS